MYLLSLTNTQQNVAQARAVRAMGEDADASGCPVCGGCFSGQLTAFLIGGLVSAVVILAAAPALRLHKEYKK